MIVTLMVCLTVLLVGYRAEPFVDRLIRIKESARDSTTNPIRGTPDPTPPIEIPDDLEAVALMESEEFARDDMRGFIKEKYTQLKDWQAVRRAVGIGELP